MKLLITIILIMFINMQLFANTPKLIPVQGVLTKGDGTPINESIDLTLSLFNSQTNTEELWTEERTDFLVENGYISLYLGEVEEIDTTVIKQADQLWLEIVFNNERMPRVRLASVPFALEAINAQRIGDITDTQINNMFNSGCAEGYFIKGYDNEGNSICAEDKTGETQETVTYRAGSGINIDDSNNISVSEDLYIGGNGIQVNNNTISVTSDVSRNPHKHDDLYYERSNNATHNNLVKFSGDNIQGYKLEKSDISETNGEVTVNKLISNTDIEVNNNIQSSTANITTINSSTVNVGSTSFEGFTHHKTTFGIYDACMADTAGSQTTPCHTELIKQGAKQLTMTNSYCSLAEIRIEGLDGRYERAKCRVILSGNNWVLEIHQYRALVQCSASCLIWQ